MIIEGYVGFIGYIYIYMHVCVYIYIYVCVCIYIYISVQDLGKAPKLSAG